PLLLTALAFLLIGFYLSNGFNATVTNPTVELSESMQELTNYSDDLYKDLLKVKQQSPEKFEDIEFLQSVTDGISGNNTFIMVRKDDAVYYSGNDRASGKLMDMLPAYGGGDISSESGFYYKNLERYVKQIDFKFSDGAKGSLFVVTAAAGVISRRLLADMTIAIMAILVFTSGMLTRWISKSVFSPLGELNVAMQKIKEGNFDYSLPTEAKGEMGDLYRNYEDMRLRLKESSEEKVELERNNKELISNISHDLKTPITAIKGYVEGIMDGVADTPEKVDKYIKTIYNKANDMDKLINELTLYSGIENSRIPYNFHRINVADYFGDCVEEVGLDLESKSIKLDYENMVDRDTLIIADPEQLKKVINNIISNSVKYMDKHEGHIAIRILDEADSIRVEIEDNGKGIAQQDLQKIFDRFYRTDTSRNSAQGGSGIGLSIVKKIIEDHGGYIWATSKEGAGTCMHFVLRKYIELQATEV
ncbi:MAG: HAMP domain-containing histidine kinase, partial [Lachnospiraceae bacterium]|nr:HAMP domain-containing histidine kinase [Lachnospiraceae bacterium]